MQFFPALFPLSLSLFFLITFIVSNDNDLGDILAHWTTQTLADRDFIRLIQREAVDYNWPEDDENWSPPVEKEPRENYYDIQINMIRNLQAAGRLDPTLDTEMLFLALLGLISLPTMLPQIALLSTGLESNSPEFVERWTTLLKTLAAKLRS